MTSGMRKWHVSYQRTIGYEVENCPNIFHPQNTALLSVGKRENTRRFVVVDGNVEKYFSAEIRNYFNAHKVDAKIVTFRSGEENKSVDNYLWILRELDAFPINRRDEPIIAIGGGVLTDVVGFVASSYRRGVPHIKIPTTLMGYIDASVGIKTGVNFNENKNRLGSFEPPKKVFLDRVFLKTLPKRQILNGVCEILKLAIIKDPMLFELLESHGAACVDSKFQDEIGGSILNLSIEGMIEELEPNLFEENLARKVDFGHTFSYGLETHHDAQLLHGEAVLIDMIVSSILAKARNLLSCEELNRIFDLVAGLGIVIRNDLVSPELLWNSLEERTYHRNGLQRVPLPAGIGNCTFVNDINFEEIQSACKILENRMVIDDTVYEYRS
ncbi:MAG: sedoheptulose 7-phosphate cyclase [Anaerolineales bacterium]|nr:sedoheptulose 7-phosphate cyclase [Anaerolineales bacterium]